MQKRIEAMLGSQLFAIAALTEQLGEAQEQLKAATARIKELEDKLPKEDDGKGKDNGA